MSMALGFSGRDKSRRRSCHRRNDSGELDVFAANTYLSAIDDKLCRRGATTTLYQQLGLDVRDDQYCTTTKQGWREGRISIDIPMSHHHNHQANHHTAATDTQPQGAMEKKHRQPSSPGGKLASFFSSLMSQKLSKKKNSPNPNSIKDGATQEESPSSWRRIRRSSIGHFMSSNSTRIRTTTSSDTTATVATSQCVSVKAGSEESRCTTKNTDTDPKSIQSSLGGSDSRSQPSRVINTPIKSFKEFSGFSDQKKPYKSKTSTTNPSSSTNLDRLEERFVKCINGPSEKQPKGMDRCRGGSEKDRSWVDPISIEECRDFKRFMEEDGGESDSSSDLFELKLNYEHEFHLGFCSSGLPVYESTHMDTIKRSSAKPVANV